MGCEVTEPPRRWARAPLLAFLVAANMHRGPQIQRHQRLGAAAEARLCSRSPGCAAKLSPRIRLAVTHRMRALSNQVRTKAQFLGALDTAQRIYGPAREMCLYDGDSFDATTYQPNVAAKVIGLAFLSAVAAWEDFLANLYLGYLSGYPAGNGYLPNLRYGRARNKSHALLLAAGESNERDAERRMKWNSFRWVQATSEIHFGKSNIFQRVADADVEWLDLAVTLRNRVAHNSDSAKSKFKLAFNRLLGLPKGAPLPPGFSPGKFMICSVDSNTRLRHLASDDHHWGDVFEGYIVLWARLSDALCPSRASDD
jgi:hypothetical protein